MLAVLDEVVGPDMIALLRSPVDGSPQVVRFDATTLWHLRCRRVGARHSAGVVAGTGNSSSQDQNFHGGGIVIAELHDPDPAISNVTEITD